MNDSAGASEQDPKGIFVYGGCVSRDAFSQMGPTVSLVGYVARQSLISSFNPAARLKAGILPSGFQNRMVAGDIKSDLREKLVNAAHETDALIIDILVERLGVTRLRGGSFVTMSSELKKSMALEAVKGQTRGIRFATDEHFRLWSEAASNLGLLLDEIGLRDKTLVLETPWAELTSSGMSVKANASMTSSAANASYTRYYRFLSDECGLATYRLPDEHVVSAEDHKWGVAPYHYIPPAYEGIVKRIYEITERE